MGLHANARLSPLGRQLLCQRIRLEGWAVEEVAFAANASERTAYRWLARYDAGEPMTDRSSRPHSSPQRTSAKVEAAIERLRRLRKTRSTIAALLRMAVSTVCAVLARLGLNRLSRLEPLEPPDRYCRRHPGELIHLDVRKLGRFDKPAREGVVRDQADAAPAPAGRPHTSAWAPGNLSGQAPPAKITSSSATRRRSRTPVSDLDRTYGQLVR